MRRNKSVGKEKERNQQRNQERGLSYDSMLLECENGSRTLQALRMNLNIMNKDFAAKIKLKRVQKFIKRKLGSKQKQLTNQICNHMRKKTQSILEREIYFELTQEQVDIEMLKVVDYFMEKNRILTKIKQDKTYFDEEQLYLNSFIDYLKSYYRKM